MALGSLSRGARFIPRGSVRCKDQQLKRETSVPPTDGVLRDGCCRNQRPAMGGGLGVRERRAQIGVPEARSRQTIISPESEYTGGLIGAPD